MYVICHRLAATETIGSSMAIFTNAVKFLVFFYGWLAVASVGIAATKLESLTVGYSNFTGTYGPLWLAVEERVGTKYGLDLRAIYAGRVRPQQLLATGDVPIVIASATGTMTAHIVGVRSGAGSDDHQ